MQKPPDSVLVRLKLTGRLMELAKAASPDGDLAEGVRHLMTIGVEADRIKHESRDLADAVVDALDTVSASVADIRNMVERMDADRQAWQRALAATLERAGASPIPSGLGQG